MMIRSFIATALLLAPSVLAAQIVEPSQGRLEILGTARPACVIRTPAPAAGDNMAFVPVGVSSGEVRIVDFVDANAQSRGASIDLVVPVICNSPHRVTVRSANGGLRRLGPPVAAGPFASFVPYQVSTFWANQQAVGGTQAGPLAIDSAAARAGEVGLRISVAPGGQPLVAGPYGDQIVLELQAAN